MELKWERNLMQHTTATPILECDVREHGFVGCGECVAERGMRLVVVRGEILVGLDGRSIGLENELEGLKKSKENGKLLSLKITWHEKIIFLEVVRHR